MRYTKFSIIIISILVYLLLTFPSFAQGTAGSNADQELRNLINLPTAGVIEKYNIGLDFEILPSGNVISRIDGSPFKNFSIGFSYGAYNLIGTGNIELYKRPGFHLKFRFLTETRNIPSLTFGLNSQGKGPYLDSLNRYLSKSPGVFLASTKNYKFLGYLSFHSLVNYSFENADGDSNINFGFGLEKTLGSFLSFLIEYDLALNDNATRSVGKNKGYLNMGLRLSPARGLTVGFDIKDITKNTKNTFQNHLARSMFIEYLTSLD